MTVEISTVQAVEDLLKLLTTHPEIMLTKANVPVAKLMPVQAPTVKSARKPNLHSGVWIRADFDNHLPREFWADKL